MLAVGNWSCIALGNAGSQHGASLQAQGSWRLYTPATISSWSRTACPERSFAWKAPDLTWLLGTAAGMDSTRALVADRPLLPSCVTLGLSLTLRLSFVNGDDSLSLLIAEKIKVACACSLGNQCPSHVMPPTSQPLTALKLLSLKYPSFSSVIAGR